MAKSKCLNEKYKKSTETEIESSGSGSSEVNYKDLQLLD
jgi:hypothetical protein